MHVAFTVFVSVQPQLIPTSCTTVYYFRPKGPWVFKKHDIKGYGVYYGFLWYPLNS